MIQASAVEPKSRGGRRTRWKEDPALIREYLRIYREAIQDDVSVTRIAGDFGYCRTHVYWIINQVQRSIDSGELPRLLR